VSDCLQTSSSTSSQSVGCPTSMAELPQSDGDFQSPSKSSPSSFSSLPSGSSPNHPDGWSKSAEKMKLDTSWDDFEAKRALMLKRPIRNCQRSKRCREWRRSKRYRLLTCLCSRVEAAVIFTSVDECSWLSGCKFSRNGSVSLESPSVRISSYVTIEELMQYIDAPTIFRLSGFNSDKAQWISGLNNIFYMVRLSYYRSMNSSPHLADG
jgi:hypothetical protein